jgi:hypothetical protein
MVKNENIFTSLFQHEAYFLTTNIIHRAYKTYATHNRAARIKILEQIMKQLNL